MSARTVSNCLRNWLTSCGWTPAPAAIRRRRIAAGAGVQPQEVSQFLKQFDTVRALMKQMMSMSVWQRIKMVTGLSKMGAFDPGAEGRLKTKGNTGHRKSARERAEERKKKKKRR